MQHLSAPFFLDSNSNVRSASPNVDNARQYMDEATDLLLWTAAQAHSLTKLKVFSSMAKSVNDQQ